MVFKLWGNLSTCARRVANPLQAASLPHNQQP
jgi:hypothetical protein